MAVTAPNIVYNFNENSATTIRDYSENGNDGTSSTITVAATGRSIGYDGVWDATTEAVSMGNITYLNGSSNACIHLAIAPQASVGELGAALIMYKSGQLDISYNYGTGNLEVSLTDALATTATLTTALTLGTWYDITVIYTSNVVTLYKDGVSAATDGTLSGALVTNGNTMYLGTDGVTNSAKFLLNEMKLYNTAITTANMDAWIADQNGVLSDNKFLHGYAVGDVAAQDTDLTRKYFVVTHVADTATFRFLPITSGITGGMTFARVGHLWDTARQWSLLIDTTPEITFYDLVTKSSEAFTDAKKTHTLNRDGLVKKGASKTANYTVTSSAHRIYVDSSGGAFTVTLESSPATDRELEIIDSVGSCGTNTVTVDGNGKNIIGSATALMNLNYISFILVYNGTQWNLK